MNEFIQFNSWEDELNFLLRIHIIREDELVFD
jgi:hypothetical protein